MEIPMPRVCLTMDCIEGVWESLEGGLRCRFRGTVRFTMISLAHPKRPPRVMEALIEWEQTTPARFDSDTFTPEFGPPSDLEEDPKEDPEEDPEEYSEPVEDEDSVNGLERTLSSEPAGDASESSHRWRLEWLANYYQPQRALVAEHASSREVASSMAFSVVRVVVRDVDQPGPSGAATTALSFDASSEEDSDTSNTEASSSGDIW